MPKHLTTNDSSSFVAASTVGQASGIAPLGDDSKIPSTFLPDLVSAAVSSVNEKTGDVLLSASDVGAVAASAVGNPNGVAPLDATGRMPVSKLPLASVQTVNGYQGPSVSLAASDVGALTQADADGRYVALNQLGAVNGVATLDTTGKVVSGQLPSLVSLDTTASNIQPLGTQAAGSVGKAADSSHVHAMPRLDQVQAPTANVGMNSKKITSLANGTVASDAATFGQIPTTLPPSGSAGGDLSGTYPNPSVAKVNGIAVSGTPTSGQVLTASSGTAAVWQTPATAPVTSVNNKTGAVSLTASDVSAVPTSSLGAANGVATLDGTVKVPVAQIPDLSGTYTTLATYGNTFMPSDHGMIAWTMDPSCTTSNGSTLTSGYVYLMMIVLRQAATISKINVVIGTAGATLTANQCFAGLYTTAGVRVALTADQSTAWTSAGNKTMNLTSSYSAAAGKYYVALLVNGTTSPTFACGSTFGANFTPGNANLAAGSYRWCRGNSGSTALPASITLSGYTGDANNFYAAVL